MLELNGIQFESLHFICPECGAIDDISYRFLESNKSIQARCVCGKWIGNVKYDKRSKEEIRRDKIDEWKKKREATRQNGKTSA